MKCSCCSLEIEWGEEREHRDQTLCEDCYMDTLSQMRTCDPWSTHSAKSFEKHGGSTSFTPMQSKILSRLKKTGGSESQALLKKLGTKLTLVELKQELSALRHMEKIGGKRIGDQVIWQLW